MSESLMMNSQINGWQYDFTYDKSLEKLLTVAKQNHSKGDRRLGGNVLPI
jgi:hypothetical protein